MSEIEIPKHPLGYQCRNCVHFLDREAQNMVVLPNGEAMPTGELMARGHMIADYPQARMGPCTVDPQWTRVCEHHWCGQFRMQFEGEISNDN